MGTGQPDPGCSICGKPLRMRWGRIGQNGEFSHLRCRSQQLLLRAIDGVDRATAARHRAGEILEQNTRRLAWARSIGVPFPSPAQFLIEGMVVDWNSATRVLTLNSQSVVLESTVSMQIPSKGVRVTASGHID